MRTINRKTLGRTGLLLLACLFALPPMTASADDGWQPSRHVTMIVPFRPGGGSDIFGRALMSGLEKVAPKMNGSVSNVVGGSGAVGYVKVMQRQGSPYYLLAVETGGAITLPLLNQVPFSYDRFTPIAEVAEDHTMILVAADSPYHKLSDLVSAAKNKRINIGISGKGSPASLAFKLIQNKSGANFNRVVFESGSANNAALLGGNVAAVGANPGEAIELIKAGKVRALTVFAKKRLSQKALADIPTIAQAGFDVDITPTLQFRGVFAPPGLSDAETQYWAHAIQRWSKTDSYKRYIEQNSLTPEVRTGQAFNKFLKQQHNTIAPLVKK